MTRTAIVGAGIAGLVAARRLREDHDHVEVFDKARLPGGRLSTRAPHDVPIEATFDHGAQYFTARGEAFRAEVERWVEAGVAALWEAPFVAIERAGRWTTKSDQPARYVGVPYMRRIAETLAHGCTIHLQTRVGAIERRDGSTFSIKSVSGDPLGSFDRVLINAPPAQAAALLAEVDPELSRRAAAVELDPCWATLVAFERPLDVELSAAFVNLGEDRPLRWIAREPSKPGRPASPQAWTLHAQHVWSDSHLEDEAPGVARLMLEAFRDAIAAPHLPSTLYLRAHRWRYAIGAAHFERDFLQSEDARLGVCGDWCGTGRVEGAYMSGLSVGRAWSNL